ncbi:hypothetical protein [Methylobacterium hispanicum]|uniref:hypothetical protein n=1 Tax=Methylobacterium hispanicum TaxID=270350 RepID=UPI002F31ACCB
MRCVPQILLWVLCLALAPAVHAADVSIGYVQGPGGYYNPTDRSGPYTINAAGNAQLLGVPVPLTVSSMPFRRLHSAPIRLKAIGPVPKSFPISRPPEATTYRIVVPCDVDIRLLGTMTVEEAVTEDTGVLYLARTEATMGTTRPNFISAMTVGTPTGDCTPEMHYGMGGG